MECTKIMLQARDFSAGAKIRVYILKKKKWSVKNEEHQEQDIDVFCGSKLTSVLAKILKCIFESQQPARLGSCPHFSCREADPGKNTSSHKLILKRSPSGIVYLAYWLHSKREKTVGNSERGLSNWWQPVDSTSYGSFTTLCCAAGIYNHLFHWIGHFSFSNNRWQCAQAISIKSDWTFSGSEELRYNLTKELRCNLTTDFILPERTPVSNCWKFDVSLIVTILRTKWCMCRYQISWYQWRNLHIYENAKDVMISITLTAYW